MLATKSVKLLLQILKTIPRWLIVAGIVSCLFTLLFCWLIQNHTLEDISWIFLFTTAGVLAAFFPVLIFRWLRGRLTRKRLLFSLGTLAIVIFLFYAEEDLRGWLTWDHFKQQAEAQGERFDYASIVPPPVPDDKNFALTPVVASTYEYLFTTNGKPVIPHKTNVVDRLAIDGARQHDWENSPTNRDWRLGAFTDLKAWQAYYRTPSTNSWVDTNEFPVAVQPQAPAADVLLALNKHTPTLDELLQASLLPYSRFPLVYDSEHPFALLLPHLSGLKRCVLVLQLRTLAELELGESDKALNDVKFSFRLVESTRTEPFLISHLVRVACLQILMQPIWEGLNRHQWSEAQTEEIQRELGKLDFLTDCNLAMRGERNQWLAFIEHLRRNRSYDEIRGLFFFNGFGEVQHREWKEFPFVALYHLAPDGWFYQNEVVAAKLDQKFWLRMADPTNHLAYPAIVARAQGAIYSMPLRPGNSITRMLLPALGAVEQKLANAQAMADLAQVACALERYHLAHGDYPEKLDVLMPQFIAQIPHDVIGGKPLHYHRIDGGKFALYSIGWNETDDGGQIGLNNYGRFTIELGDWVWPNP